MNNREKFLNAEETISIYTGGAGRGSSYTGLLKFKDYLKEKVSCAVIMKNHKDMKVCGGIYETAKELFLNETQSLNHVQTKITFKNGATLEFVSSEHVRGRKFDYVFIDNAAQLDDVELTYALNSFKKKAWLSVIPDTVKGVLFDMMKDYYTEYEDRFEFNHDHISDNKYIGVYSGTCLDNPELLEQCPNYIKQLQSLSKIDRDKLLYGHIIK